MTEAQKEQVETLIKEREKYRQDKEWAKADEIKRQLTELGVTITDTPKGTTWELI